MLVKRWLIIILLLYSVHLHSPDNWLYYTRYLTSGFKLRENGWKPPDTGRFVFHSHPYKDLRRVGFCAGHVFQSFLFICFQLNLLLHLESDQFMAFHSAMKSNHRYITISVSLEKWSSDFISIWNKTLDNMWPFVGCYENRRVEV